MLVCSDTDGIAAYNLTQLQIIKETLRHRQPLASVLPSLGVRSESEAFQCLAVSLKIQLADLAKTEADADILNGFPAKLVHKYGVFPLGCQDSGALLVAVANPFELQSLDAVSAAVGKPVVPVLALPAELGKLIKSHFGVGAETIDGLMAQVTGEDGVEVLDDVDWDQSGDAQLAQEASVVRLVNEILTEAVEAKASDIHIESQEHGIKIRYRIDGILQTQPMPPEINRFQSAIVSRLKIMAHLNIAEKRVPQDGRIKLKVQGREIDLRLSIIPMLHGEGIVMRILDKDRMDFTLRGVGMDEDIYEQFTQLIKKPHGIVLVTGPTGSGKTTTLYSALNEIKDEATKIITTEDPIEYQLDGINQIQVHAKVGMTFAASLRAILRHDPDVVLVGEIRDLETAENAIQASLTGHLVFSTLHTNDAAGAFMRLSDMGVEPFLIGTTVEGIMAQRLVRKLCPHCKEKFEPIPAEMPKDFPFQQLLDENIDIFRPVGCRECRNTGYSGRVAIYELLTATEDVRLLASAGRQVNEIKAAARKDGMMTLRENGWRKVFRGITSVDEIIRTAKED
ncbi:MAG: Flp pilus assembly complex ATPase component TadA [Planctomycetaceae bacterium]|jgi:general secretion pathway protein E/type IV pilus assembly protein PilB|nr:Flp pilus assembly complex ATPase component TadA [Planctomycetaceae bacterium]